MLGNVITAWRKCLGRIKSCHPSTIHVVESARTRRQAESRPAGHRQCAHIGIRNSESIPEGAGH